MRIGINALYLLPGKVGGSETYIRNLVQSLLKIDRDNTYVIFINKESIGIFQEFAPASRSYPVPSRRPIVQYAFSGSNSFYRSRSGATRSMFSFLPG